MSRQARRASLRSGPVGRWAVVLAATFGGVVGVWRPVAGWGQVSTPPGAPQVPPPALPPIPGAPQTPPAAGDRPLEPSEVRAVSFRVSELSVDYLEHLYTTDASGARVLQAGLPALEVIRATELSFSKTTDADGRTVLGDPRNGGELVTITLGALGTPDAMRVMRWDAITHTADTVVRLLTDQGPRLATVAVGPTSDQIETTFGPGGTTGVRDLRPAGTTSLDLRILVGVVTAVAAQPAADLGAATATQPTTRPLSPLLRRIAEGSPVTPRDTDAGRSLIRRDALDDYIFRLNRHPGRRVDVALSQGDELGALTLDYLVSEQNPLTVYLQAANTGSSDGSSVRERVGLTHTQLTGADDILNLDYSTTSFDGSSQSASASYERPMFGSDRLRGRMFGTYSDFSASDVGLAGAGFEGSTLEGGLEASYNLYQRREFFLDLVGGGRYSQIEVDNSTLDSTSDVGDLAPYLSLRADRTTELSSFDAQATLTYGHLFGSEEDRTGLGRSDTDQDFVTLQGSVGYSFFLEPVLFAEQFRAGRGTLAHEVAFSARGLWSPGFRLIPQEQPTIGGLYSVRGYAPSLAAGDNMVVASAEYRWHLPRSLAVNPQARRKVWYPTWDSSRPFGPKDFRYAPNEAFGRPDWDLVLKAFADAGRVTFNDRDPASEENATLTAVGLGLELQVYQNVNVQGYWGIALNDVDAAGSGNGTRATAGSSQFWIVVTLLFN